MKNRNIYLLLTDKPSRLYSFYGILQDLSYGKTFTIVNEKIAKVNLHKDLEEYQEKLIKAHWKSENIYITSDKEIKEWIIVNGTNGYSQPMKYSEMFPKDKFPNGHNSSRVKILSIILTTDPDLIKDGVQAIPDEFLEWFVKNPTCEFVEVKTEYKDGYGNWFIYNKEFWDKHDNKPSFGTRFKVIIPQEESKQELDISKYIIGIDPYDKQETLEEAAESYIKDFDLSFYDTVEEIPVKEFGKKDFIEGAKWMQERMVSKEAYEDSLNMQKTSNVGYESKINELKEKIKTMYSEDDLQEAFYAHKDSWIDYEKWLENFKNKK